jgi:hypothetical protein
MIKKKRKYNTHLIKQTLSYSTQDIVSLFGLHKRTVQEWYIQGLLRIDDRKPFLVLGFNLKEFLDKRQGSRKRHCQPNEFFCMKCRASRTSWENVVDIKFLNEKRLMIIGLCAQCNTPLNKISSPRKLDDLHKIFVVQKIHHEHLFGSNSSIYNTDKNEVIIT